MRVRPWLALTLLLVACGGGDRKPAATVLEVIVVSDPPGRLAPDRADWNPASAMLVQATSAGLVTLNADGEAVPAAAQSWRVSDDGFSYIFRLADLEWSDERAVTGRDFVSLFRDIMQPGSRHPFKPYLQALENGAEVGSGRKKASALGVASPMSDIVELRLSSTRPTLLQLLAQPEMALPARDGGRVSLGPYRVTRTEGSITLLTLNDRLAEPPEAASSGVKLIAEPDIDAAIERFRADNIPVLTSGTTGDYQAVRAAGLERLARVDPVLGIYGYRVDRSDGVVADLRLRRALTMAIDRDAVVRSVGIEGLSPALGVIPAGLSELSVPAVPDWQSLDMAARLTMARNLIEEIRAAGADPAQPIRISLAVPAKKGDRAIAAQIVTAWRAIGVEADIVDGEEEADLSLYERVAPTDLATWFLRPFECHRKSYCNKSFDDALSDARVALSPIGRAAALARADRLLVDDVALIPVMTAARWSLVAQGTTGWTPNRWGVHPLQQIHSVTRH